MTANPGQCRAVQGGRHSTRLPPFREQDYRARALSVHRTLEHAGFRSRQHYPQDHWPGSAAGFSSRQRPSRSSESHHCLGLQLLRTGLVPRWGQAQWSLAARPARRRGSRRTARTRRAIALTMSTTPMPCRPGESSAPPSTTAARPSATTSRQASHLTRSPHRRCLRRRRRCLPTRAGRRVGSAGPGTSRPGC